jgi:hypothetical protein
MLIFIRYFVKHAKIYSIEQQQIYCTQGSKFTIVDNDRISEVTSVHNLKRRHNHKLAQP